MNIQQCRYVVTIAKAGSFSEAAKQLFVTQPSLSSSIKELENELGVALFIRSKSGVRLTEEGQDFLFYATKLVHQVSLLENRYQYDYKKTFVISAQHYDFLSLPFLQVINAFEADYRTFHLIETTTQTVLEHVRDFHSELGILYLNETNKKIYEHYFRQANLHFEPIGTYQTHIFLRNNHPLAAKKTITLAELSAYPQVRFIQNNSSPDFDEDPLAVPTEQSTLYANDRGTLMNLLYDSNAYASGLGVLHGFASNYIRLIPLSDSPYHTLGIVTNINRQPSAIAQQFTTYIKSALDQTSTLNV